MPQIGQTVKYTDGEIRNILMEKAKQDLTEGGGKQVQGKVECKFHQISMPNENDKNSPQFEAVVNFERAGK